MSGTMKVNSKLEEKINPEIHHSEFDQLRQLDFAVDLIN